MTIEQAIIHFKKRNRGLENNPCCQAIQSRVDRQKSEMDRNNLAIQALEKQLPKKITHNETLRETCTCPHCNNCVDQFEKWYSSTIRIKFNYCRFCGQRLDWEGAK